ncbi:YSIRK-type signal peptide-containing protein [Aerococcus christensenii]|uniref:YSIRK-type signal peptide-containing protein n=1 Tax=Aerococcus christensenii TaxID=87541 RepID=UPI003F438C64
MEEKENIKRFKRTLTGDKITRFAIRKYSFGVASVAIASLFLVFNSGMSVQAATQAPITQKTGSGENVAKTNEENKVNHSKLVLQQNRDSDSVTSQATKIAIDKSDVKNTKLKINEQNAEMIPNHYAWGTSDNTYSVDGEKHTVTFNFEKPKDGKITSIAIFPARTNGFNNEKSERGIDFYSKNSGKHQAYSGEYKFTENSDGSATLTMSTLFRDGNIGGAEKYTASRSIFVYVTKDGSSTETIAYKTNVFRAVTLVPPKTSGSVVLKYNQKLTPEKVQAAITEAGNVETARSDKKSVNDQLSGAFTQNINVKSDDAYDAKQFEAINKETSAQGAKDKTYVAGAKTLNTYMVTDLGFKSQAIPLTVARYDMRIDKPIVADPTQLSKEVKEDIAKKLAKINGVSTDKVTFDGDGNAVIHFDGVDEKGAPKIKLSDLVLKQLKDGEFAVPSNDKAVFVANPLGYSNAELDRIKQAIFDANKENKDLGLTSVDQITLEYVKGDTTVGHENIGISNGQAENKITVKIKTDKAVAEFTSNVKENRLTKLPNIRTDYDVTWTKTKIDGRDTDEGISWSNDQKTTIIYRYDPTKAQEFDTTKILGLLKATPKDTKSGLRDLTGGEQLAYEGTGNNARKSHMHYALQNGEPTGELTLGNMGGAYWSGNQKVSNSDVDLGDNLSIAGSYSWDKEAGPVTVAGKKDKIFKARLFVEPYGMTYYKDVYLEQGRNPGNTAKAINVIFVPQTNHKTKDLKTSVEEHKTVAVEGKDVPTQHEYYNASDKVKSDYDDALKVAKALYDQVKDTKESDLTEKQKADIDNATIKLDKARKALDGAETNKDGLNKSIEANGKAPEGQTAATPGTVTTDKYKNVTDQAFQTDDGKPDTKKNEDAKKAKTAYDEALAAAEKVKADANATQKAVDDAKAKLDAAREKLNEFSTNKDKLNAAIAEHGKVKDGRDAQGAQTLANADPAYQNATDAERKAYDEAVKKANELSADPNASQKDVNAAIDELQKAKAALDAKATDKSQLITAEKLTFDNPNNDASKQSTFYKNALNKQTNGANDQEKQAAKKAVNDYNNALTKAREVLKNDKATQKEVDAAKDALTKAEKALHDGYATDPNELTKVLADNFSGYLMPAYFNAFDKAQTGDEDAKKAFKDYNDAYQKAKELKKKLEEAKTGGDAPDQTQINEAKTALEKARTVIDKYATNTSRLSAAVFNDLAIQNSPAYKNVSEGDASAEAKAAKTKYDKAVEKLHQALNKKMPKDQANGKDIPDTNTPDKDGNLEDKDYLKNIQAHAQGEPLDRDITSILKEMNDAAAELNKFATKTDELLKSVNEHDNTQKTPAFKNANQPDFKKDDGTTADDTKNNAAKAAVDAYGKALNTAKELLKNPAATQKEVNDAKTALDNARKELDKYNTDTAKLTKSVGKHGSTEGPAATEGTQTSDAYRNASDPHFMKEQDGKLVPDTDKNTKAAEAKKAYDEALTKAQELLKKHDDNATPQDAKPTQKEINAALKALDDARTKLDTYKTDTTKLEEETRKSTAENAHAATEGDFEYTPEFKNAQAKTSNGVENADVTAYKEALKKARDLAKAAHPTDSSATNSSHPTQQQINEALDALKAAKKQIEDNYKTNLEALTAAKDFAGGDFKKTPEYKNALAKKTAGDQGAIAALGKDGEQTGFDNVLKKVTDNLNDKNWKGKVTQKFVNELLKKLQESQEKIAKEYKTDAIKLEREVGDKDQDGKPVTPPFEASVPYKNALEKAKTEADKTGNDSATKKLEDYNKKLKDAQDLIAQVNSTDPNADPDKKPTQAQVDEALAALKKAKKDLVDAFKTNAAALKKEAKELKEDGGAKEDKDKFENSTEFKNASAKKGADGKDIEDVQTYKAALEKANKLLELFGYDGNPKADIPAGIQIPTQQEVDEAQKALKEIKDKILANYKTSPHDLQQEVDKSRDKADDMSDGLFENTPAFKNATAKGDDAAKKALKDYNDKLDAAKKLLDKFDRTTGKLKQGETAPTQKELDDALDALKAAKKKIEDNYSTIKYDLRQEAGKDSDFTKTPEYQNAQAKGDDASKQALEAYKKALEDANKVLGDKDATQAQVDDALKKLQDAKSKLTDGYKTNKSDLNTEAGKDSDFTKTPEYQNAQAKGDDASKQALENYKKALDEANKVLGDKNATQAQVDEALKALQVAKTAIMNSYKTDKQALQQAFKQVIEDGFEDPTYQHLLEEIKRVLADPDATQAQVDEVYARLIGIGRTHRTGQQDHTSPDRTSNGTQGNHQSNFEHSQSQQGHSTLPDTTLHTVTKHMGEVTMRKRVQANTARTLRYKKLPQTGSGMSSVSGLGLLLLASAGLFLLPRKRETKD